jgi:ferredoxin
MEHSTEREVVVGVNQDTCIGCGLCAVIEPEVFSYPTPKAKVLGPGEPMSERLVFVTSSRLGNILQAVKECPVDAIETSEVPAQPAEG